MSSELELVLITDRVDRTSLLHELFAKAGIPADIRRLAPRDSVLERIHHGERYPEKSVPSLFFFDFIRPNEQTIGFLRAMAFEGRKPIAPLVLITSPESVDLLDSGEIDGGETIMFSPTGLASFVRKMRSQNRDHFLKALQILFQFGPILVRAPQTVLMRDPVELRKSA